MRLPTSLGNSTIDAALRCVHEKAAPWTLVPVAAFFVPRLAQHPILKFPKKKPREGHFLMRTKSYTWFF